MHNDVSLICINQKISESNKNIVLPETPYIHTLVI
jgi:hypothetical protein